MKKILFACDLDNTLIHSWKHKREGDICVEWLNGNEQGYIAEDTCEMLRKVISLVEFVPVTTRSVAQYQRIMWPEGCQPRYAITTHGAIFLEDGKVNESWQQETIRITEPLQETLEEMVKVLERMSHSLRTRIVDQSYTFAYCADDTETLEAAQNYPHDKRLYRACSGRKVYYIPWGIDKGTAVKRFQEMMGYKYIFSAGDSEMDVPMLKIANASFVPENLGQFLQNHKKLYVFDEADFSHDFLVQLNNAIRNYW